MWGFGDGATGDFLRDLFGAPSTTPPAVKQALNPVSPQAVVSTVADNTIGVGMREVVLPVVGFAGYPIGHFLAPDATWADFSRGVDTLFHFRGGNPQGVVDAAFDYTADAFGPRNVVKRTVDAFVDPLAESLKKLEPMLLIAAGAVALYVVAND